MLKLKSYGQEMIYKYYLCLGSNVEPRLSYITQALLELGKIGTILRKSSLYETEPWGVKYQPSFLNGIVLLQTILHPLSLLASLKKIEKSVGRKQSGKWRPREIDIDIILGGNIILKKNNLMIPHVQLANRNFVLIPMMELEKTCCIPGSSNTIETLFRNCSDKAAVKRISSSW